MNPTSPAPNLTLEVAKDCEAMSRRAAELILTELTRKPDLLLCASAGETPRGTSSWTPGLASAGPSNGAASDSTPSLVPLLAECDRARTATRYATP